MVTVIGAAAGSATAVVAILTLVAVVSVAAVIKYLLGYYPKSPLLGDIDTADIHG